jgi:hypothetical protein
MRRRLVAMTGTLVFGWVVVLLLNFVLQRTLLPWMAHLLGPSWLPTAGLALDCAVLTATGWAIGRVNRPDGMPTVLVFAATLCLWDFGPTLPFNVPWLVRLTRDAFRDSRYVESLIGAVGSHAFLFGSLIAGGILSRPPEGVANSWLR